jgi:hypothetical protein
MSWQLGVFAILAVVVVGGLVWFERSRPSTRILAAVGALAALGVAGRVALAPLPNVVATTDIALLAGFSLGGPPGFAVGALSALVSNFWLGQGPWTPWQMAGWGLVGAGGALLATLTRRRIGRLGLAAAAALAGLLYGALLDLSDMVTYGGEQSLDRYLALSARAIPFNLAHAIGNAALMLAAGPALLRILERYRTRFEVRWREPATATASAGAGGAAAVLVALALLLPTAAPAPARASEASAAGSGSAAVWLAGARNSDGGYGHSPGASSSVGMTAWAMLGLEAAGRSPLALRGRTPVAYLRRNAGRLRATTDLSLAILAIEGSGLDSKRFGGRNLLAELRSGRRSNGSFQGWANPTAFGILALRAAGVRGRELGRSAAWLRSVQNRDGGWGAVEAAGSEADSTGAALQALAVAPGGGAQIDRGVRWLRRHQRRDGGFSLVAGGESNSQSTAWAVQGLLAAGVDPAGVRKGGRSPLHYLAARQAGDGHFSYSAASDQTPVWVTAQAIAATAGKPYPLPAVARPVRGNDPSEDGAGGGGESPTATSAGGPAVGAGTAAGRRAGGSGSGGERKRSRGTRPASVAGRPTGTLAVGAPAEAVAEIGGSPLPATPVLLGGLGGLAAALLAGFFLFRRRLP